MVAAQKGTTVSVENLFNNLPVRRRELERNIKREWGRVTAQLGQYACIQTGIKFSVSQQAAKGKKTTLFSTKGNQSTRENIVNVFGAKTLTALIPLDLNLGLDPTSGPSQRWSTQEDGGKKEIRITGHISRPASGQGRQTPDRQMFFVNSRPCGLPQFAKAFNEVYKSYSAYDTSSSPFIFANIELDTHLYDVNVSPDKRTILLHDQARMLENLKTALTTLFEDQDYTVPISQLPLQRQPSYKQLTISRETTNAAMIPQNPARPLASTESNDGIDSDNDERSCREASVDVSTQGEQGVADAEPPSTSHFPRGRGSLSIEARYLRDRTRSRSREPVAVGPDVGASSLMSNWLGMQCEDRADPKVDVIKSVADGPAQLSRKKQKPVERLERDRSEEATDDIGEPGSSVVNDSDTALPPGPSYQLPRKVVDYNKRMAEVLANGQSEAESSEPEDPIPALISPSQAPDFTPGIASTFSSRSRSQRAPAEVATITIGGHTVTSSIGTPYPSNKRQRIGDDSSSSRLKNRTGASTVSLPSFGSRLSQRFGAPGTQQAAMCEEDDEAPDVPRPSGDNESDKDDECELQEEPQSPTIFGSGQGSADGSIMEDDDTGVFNEPTLKEEHMDPTDSSQIDLDSTADGDYIDEDERKLRDQEKIHAMIEAAEHTVTLPTQEQLKRAKFLSKPTKKKEMTYDLLRDLDVAANDIDQRLRELHSILQTMERTVAAKNEAEALDSEKAEEKLSLTISKADFATMKIIGQFNLGFILASRASVHESQGCTSTADDLFIIDQHASDEKYNFERLQASTIVQSQRLVYPKTLELTALEEEIVMENLPVLEANGFIVNFDTTGEIPVGERCKLVSLPVSRETTFSIDDLMELLALIPDHPPGSVPRPAKVRKMFAMRACRSSIMIGKTLTHKHMERVVSHMGEIDKPWNCPHGRPTMRHLCGLGRWDEEGWKEGDFDGERAAPVDWKEYVRRSRGDE